MANLRGYYSGVKEGQEVLRDRHTMRLQQMAADRDQRNFDLEEQERSLTSQAMNATMPDRLNGEKLTADEKLSQQLIATGKAISGVNPKAGLDYIRQGGDYQTKAIQRRQEDLQLKSARMEMQGDIASQVVDQESANEAVTRMAEEGFVVPERYRQFNTESREWWKRRAIQSKAYRESTKIDIDRLRLENVERDTESKIQKRVADTKIKERKELHTREKIVAGKGLKFANPKEQKQELRLLSETDSRFDDLDSSLQAAVVKDVHSAALSYLKDDPSLDQSVALQRARRDVLELIDEEGNYKVIADKPKGKPSLDTWLPAAMKANPTMSEAEIKAIYNDKYGSK